MPMGLLVDSLLVGCIVLEGQDVFSVDGVDETMRLSSAAGHVGPSSTSSILFLILGHPDYGCFNL